MSHLLFEPSQGQIRTKYATFQMSPVCVFLVYEANRFVLLVHHLLYRKRQLVFMRCRFTKAKLFWIIIKPHMGIYTSKACEHPEITNAAKHRRNLIKTRHKISEEFSINPVFHLCTFVVLREDIAEFEP